MISCNDLFGLPTEGDLSSVLGRLKMVRFYAIQERDQDFAQAFEMDKHDHELFVSYLLHLPELSLDDPLIATPISHCDEGWLGNVMEYWKTYQNKLYRLAKEFCQPNSEYRVYKSLFLSVFEEYCRSFEAQFNRESKTHTKILNEVIMKVGSTAKSCGNEYVIGVVWPQFAYDPDPNTGSMEGVEKYHKPTFYSQIVSKIKEAVTPNAQICDYLIHHAEGKTNKEIEQALAIPESELQTRLNQLVQEGHIYYCEPFYKMPTAHPQ
jgi:hypothetical protein